MLKTTFDQYHINFSNSDFSHNIGSIFAKFLGYVLHSPPEGSVSQSFDLGPGYFFLSYVESSEKYFFTIIYVLCHKKITKT